MISLITPSDFVMRRDSTDLPQSYDNLSSSGLIDQSYFLGKMGDKGRVRATNMAPKGRMKALCRLHGPYIIGQS